MIDNIYLSKYKNINNGLFNDYDTIPKIDNLSIPKILFSYWDGSRISFLHYLTIYTLKKNHPDWKIILYIPNKYTTEKTWKSFENKIEYNNIDYLDNIIDLNIDIRIIDFNEIDFNESISEIIKSDYFRLYAIYHHGGIWYDMDMLFINKIQININYNTNNNIINYLENFQIYDKIKEYCNNIEEININDIYKNKYFIVIANDHFCQYFLISDRNTDYIKFLLDNIKYNINLDNYQSIGTEMLNGILPKFISDKNNIKSKLIDHNVVSPFKYYETNLLFNENIDINCKLNLSYAIHWYNGAENSKNFINIFTHTNFMIYENTISNIIKKNILYNNYIQINNMKKVSIVIAYYNRLDQLLFTLKTIEYSLYKNIEVIIIDDNSRFEEKCDSYIKNYPFDIKLININKEEKKWINPCMSYNIGIKHATGDIIIIQNPEVCHIGDCISYIVKNLRLNDWLTFNCYGLGNFDQNQQIYNKYYENNNTKNIFLYLNKLIIEKNTPGGNSAFSNNVQGWLNNYDSHFTAYHYLGAIHRRDLINRMDGGFDEEYKNGINLDDIDFIKRLNFNKFRFVTNEFNINKPFCIHLFHEKPESLIIDPEIKHEINKKIYEKKCNEMNINSDISKLCEINKKDYQYIID